MSQAKKRIKELIVAEQAQRTITDQFINHLSQADMDELRALQRNLTVSIRLDKGMEDQEPKIHIEGLTRDVYTAESAVRSENSFKVGRSFHTKTMFEYFFNSFCCSPSGTSSGRWRGRRT